MSREKVTAIHILLIVGILSIAVSYGPSQGVGGGFTALGVMSIVYALGIATLS